jgi:hypothetical protein
MEIGFDQSALVTRVAAEAAGTKMAAGLSDGRIWACDVRNGQRADVRTEAGAPISALALADGRLCWGDEEGGAGETELPAL